MVRITKSITITLFSISLIFGNGTKLSKGIYLMLTPEEFSMGSEKYMNLEFLIKNSADSVFFYDGNIFRSSGGPLTSRPEGDILPPFDELLPCQFNKAYFCYNQKKTTNKIYIEILPDAGNNIHKRIWRDPDGQTGTGYFVRINDYQLARKFTEEVSGLSMFKNKTLSDFGYKRPEIKFAIGTAYRPYVSALILRETPGKKGKKIDTLFSGDILTVTEISKKIDTIDKVKAPWVKIKTSTGKEGYVFGGFLEELR